MPAKFEIYADKKGEFRFRLKAANGESIATGESNHDKAAVKKKSRLSRRTRQKQERSRGEGREINFFLKLYANKPHPVGNLYIRKFTP